MIVLALSMSDITPFFVFLVVMMGSWWLLSLISNYNNRAEERLDMLNRRSSPFQTEFDNNSSDAKKRFSGLKDAISSLGGVVESKSELERNKLRLTLANAGFRSESAPLIFSGISLISLIVFTLPALIYFLSNEGFSLKAFEWIVFFAFMGMFLPKLVLGHLKSTRQKEIFLTLPDALDLLVVCVESGLGLDAALRKVNEEMKGHAKVICEELTISNMQMQWGKTRREVLHDLGVRTGVDDVKALAAILIQADRFGASIAQALRVQSDSMRTRRRQIAEEKAAKTAVQLIFPLVLFIFPAIFVVLVGPAAVQISNTLLK